MSKSFMDTNARLISSLGPNSAVIPTQGITTSTLIRKMESPQHRIKRLSHARHYYQLLQLKYLPVVKCLQHDVLRSSFPLKINPQIIIWV